MANEAVPVIGPYVTRDWTCAAGNAIEKGALLWGVDPKTVSGANVTGTSNTYFAGVAAMDKSVSDGDTSTRISVHEEGIFDILVATSPGEAVRVGDRLRLSGVNVLKLLSGTSLYDNLINSAGTALEAVAVSTTEVIEVNIGQR